jgi:hypothetical protein
MIFLQALIILTPFNHRECPPVLNGHIMAAAGGQPFAVLNQQLQG